MYQKKWLKLAWTSTQQVLPFIREMRWAVKIQGQVETVTLHLKNGASDQYLIERHPQQKQKEKHKSLWRFLK